MSIEQIAERLIKLCLAYNYVEAHDELFIHDALSFEPGEGPGEGTRGIRNIEKKWEEFQQAFKPVSVEIGKPVFAGNYFSLPVTQQVILKGNEQPMTLTQLAVYEVSDGKIAKEWFYYSK